MPVRECPQCKRPMNADLSMCPWCGGVIQPAPAPVDRADMPCPFCHQPIQPDATSCRWCRESLAARPAGNPGAYSPPPVLTPSREDRPGRPDATLPLVLGIIGLIAPCTFCGPIGWFLANRYEERCRVRNYEIDGAGKAAKVCSIIGTCFLAAGCCCGGLYALMMMNLGRVS